MGFLINTLQDAMVKTTNHGFKASSFHGKGLPGQYYYLKRAMLEAQNIWQSKIKKFSKLNFSFGDIY